MTGHREKLTEIAKEHGMPPLTGDMTPLTYTNYAFDLTLMALGILRPDQVTLPQQAKQPRWFRR